MQMDLDLAGESGLLSFDTRRLSFGAALLWGFASCLLIGLVIPEPK